MPAGKASQVSSRGKRAAEAQLLKKHLAYAKFF